MLNAIFNFALILKFEITLFYFKIHNFEIENHTWGRDVNIAIGRWFDIGPQNHRYNIIFIAYFPYHSKVEQLKLDVFLMQRNIVSQ